jgi:hypothetical protein
MANRTAVIQAIDALENEVTRQAARISKASAACAFIDDAEVDEELVSTTVELPSRVIALRRSRVVVDGVTVVRQPSTRSPMPSGTATTTSETQTDVAAGAGAPSGPGDDSGRVAELEAEIERLKQKHRTQLLAAEKDLSRLRRARGADETERTPSPATVT